jgi:release factor glutamine methyltransferase
MSGNSKTVLEVLQSTAAYFAKNGVESPRLNAEHLVAHTLGKKRIELYLEFDRPLFEPELAPLREFLRQRAQGRPLQHLVGTVDFHGRIFKSDTRALIPRPETEQLVEFLIAECGTRNAELKILDVGTGSGVIALTLAAEIEKSEVEAVDLSDDALALARENVEKLCLAERVKLFKSDLLENVMGEFDLIVANLPYIAEDEIPKLAREVQFDPKLALDGGSLGTEIISRLITSAKSHFRPAGMLALEIGHDQADALAAELQRENYQDIQCKSDYQGVPRFLFAKYG